MTNNYSWKLYDGDGKVIGRGDVFDLNIVQQFGGPPIVQIKGYADLAPWSSDPATPVAPVGPVCECGSEKAGSPVHSSWCPQAKP